MINRQLFQSIVAATLTIAAQSLGAQSNQQFHFSVGAGASIPTGDLGDNTNVGYNLVVGVGAHQPGQPLGLRAEGFFNQFNLQNGEGQNIQIGGITGNAIYDLTGNSGRRNRNQEQGTLYAIGGLGWYNVKLHDDVFGDVTDNKLGWNIGAGYRFPLSGFSAYVEARYNSVSADFGSRLNSTFSFVPITFGLVF
jgi:hypothetical protein